MDVNALVLFCDARGFTRWANNPEVFARLDQFAAAFSGALQNAFPRKKYFFKELGDGAMIVRELKGDLDGPALEGLIRETLTLISQARDEFRLACESFATSIGHRAELSLG